MLAQSRFLQIPSFLFCGNKLFYRPWGFEVDYHMLSDLLLYSKGGWVKYYNRRITRISILLPMRGCKMSTNYELLRL